MPVAGGTAPCQFLEIDFTIPIIVIRHQENRLIRDQIDFNPKTGQQEFTKDGKVKMFTVLTGACELDLDAAATVLIEGRTVWIRSQDRQELVRIIGVNTCPEVMLYRYHEGVNRDTRL